MTPANGRAGPRGVMWTLSSPPFPIIHKRPSWRGTGGPGGGSEPANSKSAVSKCPPPAIRWSFLCDEIHAASATKPGRTRACIRRWEFHVRTPRGSHLPRVIRVPLPPGPQTRDRRGGYYQNAAHYVWKSSDLGRWPGVNVIQYHRSTALQTPSWVVSLNERRGRGRVGWDARPRERMGRGSRADREAEGRRSIASVFD